MWDGRSCNLPNPNCPGYVTIAVSNGVLTLLRVVILIALASVVWVPIGVGVKLAAETRGEGPAYRAVSRRLSGRNPLFPVVVFLIVKFALDPRSGLAR